MTTFQVLDVDLDSVCAEHYDVGIFASGYESRSGYLAQRVDPQRVANPLVFGFTEEPHAGMRKENDGLYRRRWKQEPVPMSGDDEEPIFERLRPYTNASSGTVRLVVDYSSMSRLWYAAVLNWARFAANVEEVVMDFVYAMGKYQSADHPMVIRGIVPIPGCEGRAYNLRESIAIFGLGFHGEAALCVLDRLEADIVYTFLASPGVSPAYEEMSRNSNADLISHHKSRPLLQFPLSSIERTYRLLAEVISPHRSDGEITLVPMGPKPHVLASILAAMRFPEVACLRVSGAPDPLDVEPTGDIVATRVIIRP